MTRFLVLIWAQLSFSLVAFAQGYPLYNSQRADSYISVQPQNGITLGQMLSSLGLVPNWQDKVWLVSIQNANPGKMDYKGNILDYSQPIKLPTLGIQRLQGYTALARNFYSAKPSKPVGQIAVLGPASTKIQAIPTMQKTIPTIKADIEEDPYAIPAGFQKSAPAVDQGLPSASVSSQTAVTKNATVQHLPNKKAQSITKKVKENPIDTLSYIIGLHVGSDVTKATDEIGNIVELYSKENASLLLGLQKNLSNRALLGVNLNLTQRDFLKPDNANITLDNKTLFGIDYRFGVRLFRGTTFSIIGAHAQQSIITVDNNIFVNTVLSNSLGLRVDADLIKMTQQILALHFKGRYIYSTDSEADMDGATEISAGLLLKPHGLGFRFGINYFVNTLKPVNYTKHKTEGLQGNLTYIF